MKSKHWTADRVSKKHWTADKVASFFWNAPCRCGYGCGSEKECEQRNKTEVTV